jgi:hypothetical protein
MAVLTPMLAALVAQAVAVVNIIQLQQEALQLQDKAMLEVKDMVIVWVMQAVVAVLAVLAVMLMELELLALVESD